MVNTCFLLPDFPLSGVPYTTPQFNTDTDVKKYNVADADPLIRQHAVHWLCCKETYEISRRQFIDDWWLAYQDTESCFYARGSTVILGFRGTKATKDLYDDLKIGFGEVFPRQQEAIKYVRKLVELNPGFTFELTGHSLGGAIAREVGRELGLEVVTFNAAAPPSTPVISGPNEIDYHIVFDLISAWQQPNTIRIDKGYQPSTNPIIGVTFPSFAYYSVFEKSIPAHELKNFSNQKPGFIASSSEETRIINQWYLSLSTSDQNRVLLALFAFSGGAFRYSIPPVET